MMNKQKPKLENEYAAGTLIVWTGAQSRFWSGLILREHENVPGQIVILRANNLREYSYSVHALVSA
jgi:hypothetical protein